MTPPEWNTYPAEPAPEREPTRTVPEGTDNRRRFLKPLLGAVAAVGLVGGGGLVVGKALFGHEEPQTVEGFAKLLEDIEEKSGSTEVFEATIYPGYARVDLPVAPGDERELSYRWDGDFSMEIKGTTDDAAFDLAKVDPANFDDMCEDVSSLVSDPGTCYLIIRSPDGLVPDGVDAWISAYVSNDFSQSAWISYDLDGNEVDRTDD